jgi:TRAP-type C4-dicarboxylate transport system substrate-binding protein
VTGYRLVDVSPRINPALGSGCVYNSLSEENQATLEELIATAEERQI